MIYLDIETAMEPWDSLDEVTQDLWIQFAVNSAGKLSAIAFASDETNRLFDLALNISATTTLNLEHTCKILKGIKTLRDYGGMSDTNYKRVILGLENVHEGACQKLADTLEELRSDEG